MGWNGEMWMDNGVKISIEEINRIIKKDTIYVDGFMDISSVKVGWIRLEVDKRRVVKLVESKHGETCLLYPEGDGF
jgi:hypothetical protein